jgi:hypothetical protein
MEKFTWDKDKTLFLKENYPIKGKKWCAKNLGCKESSVRYMASKVGLKLLKDSEVHKERIRKMATTNKGKKRPEQAIVMKTLWKEGKIRPNLKKERVCLGCKKIFFRENQKNHRKTCSDKCLKKNIKIGTTYPHPKGMLGKKHSPEVKKKMSQRSCNMWENPNSKVNMKEYREYLSKKNSELHKKGVLGGKNAYSNCWRGWYVDPKNNKTHFMRSKWEHNYALYLQFLVDNHQILSWDYEVDRFEFKGIKRGVLTYLPDFKIFKNNGDIEYHEVKGYMDAKSKTKIKRMRIYYPQIKLLVIDGACYRDIKTKMSRIIKGWMV